ncbi:MAG: alcohol dehydrogenase catalytic domain-containing protein [Bacteroides sp.]|nr:alcohol dehydrogenase catalytic domain-containing protein [Bacteroides sp.]
MRQAILTAPKHVVINNEAVAPDLRNLKPNEVLINVKRIGICGSEIHSYHGLHPATKYPVVQGHEFSAVVVEVGSEVTNCKKGDKVTARPQLVCGKCGPCRRGQYNVCENLKVEAFQADGAAQDYFVTTAERVVVLPEDMSLDEGAMIEPCAVGAHASERTDVVDKNVVVSGAGTIGILVAQFCKARGARKVLITDVSDYRLEKAKECGIECVANVAKTTLKDAVKDLFGDEGYQVGFEVAGVESSIRSLMETIEKGSSIVIVGVFAKDPAISMFYLGEHELTLIGSMMYRHEDYETAVAFVSKGIVNLKPLISNRFPFEEYADAYQFIDDNRTTAMKVIIDLDETPCQQ